MKCKRCRTKAEVQIRHHNAAFCRPCFILFFQRQVERTIDKHKMFAPQEEVLVAVSGGKDSLALWDVLIQLGYRTAGLHLALGIGEYSHASTSKTEAFAHSRNLRLITVDLETEGAAIPTLARFANRPACAACGTTKRHQFDRVAYENGFNVLATGHNLDDEAARLLGNVMHWSAGALTATARDGAQSTSAFCIAVSFALSHHRVRNGRVRLFSRHRLRGRGVPKQRGRQPAHVQGCAESDGSGDAGNEAHLRAGLPQLRASGILRWCG